MKILRRYGEDGKPLRVFIQVKAQIICRNCGSLLEINPEDIGEPTETFQEEHPEANGWVDCGVCFRMLPVNTEKLVWSKE